MQDVQTLIDKAKMAASAAREAADNAVEAASAAQGYAEKAINALHATGAGAGGQEPFIYLFAIFVLAIFIGYFVVWSVTPALHTPLMSVTNAISSVIVVGALLAAGAGAAASGWAVSFGFLGLILAAVNIFGGFLVTQRMLAMYKKKN